MKKGSGWEEGRVATFGGKVEEVVMISNRKSALTADDCVPTMHNGVWMCMYCIKPF